MLQLKSIPALIRSLGPPQANCLHMACAYCNKATRNSPKSATDPASAVLFITACGHHSGGAVEEYYDAQGQEVFA
jgi:hypothetical protein